MFIYPGGDDHEEPLILEKEPTIGTDEQIFEIDMVRTNIFMINLQLF